MKQPKTFFALILMLLGLLFSSVTAVAGRPPSPVLNITDMEFPEERMVLLGGTLDGSTEQPELEIIFFAGNISYVIPVVDVDWTATSDMNHLWTAYLDLRDVPDGFYYIKVQAELLDGTKISYTLTGDPSGCTGGICLPPPY